MNSLQWDQIVQIVLKNLSNSLTWLYHRWHPTGCQDQKEIFIIVETLRNLSQQSHVQKDNAFWRPSPPLKRRTLYMEIQDHLTQPQQLHHKLHLLKIISKIMKVMAVRVLVKATQMKTDFCFVKVTSAQETRALLYIDDLAADNIKIQIIATILMGTK